MGRTDGRMGRTGVTLNALPLYSIRFRSNGPDTVYYMELSQGEIIQKPKMQELSFLFMTHCLIVMYAPVKFHEYIP